MMQRFEGKDGMRNRVDALLQQRVIGGDRALAERLAAAGEVVEFPAGSIIVEQDGGDDDVYFLINGVTEVVVNGQILAVRNGGESVGELASIDPAARRSATIRAATLVVALRVSSSALRAEAFESIQFWRGIAHLAAERLRQRARFHLPPHSIPIMFVGSSRESLPIAQALVRALAGGAIEVRLWSEAGVFGPSLTPIEALLAQVEVADFALFVFGPDDKVRSRDVDHDGPRDNVVFEMGLFLGRLGRERVFMLYDEGLGLKIPSDLAGVLPVRFKRDPGGTLSDNLTSACEDIRRAVGAKGPVANRTKV